MIAARVLGPLLLAAAALQGPYLPGAQEGLLERALALLTDAWICTLAATIITMRSFSPAAPAAAPETTR
jgi:hypothetical protein